MGFHFFEILQKKSGVKVNCPITKELKEIMHRYNNQPPPKLSDQKINKYLKLIGRRVDMNEDVLCHDTKGGVKRTLYTSKVGNDGVTYCTKKFLYKYVLKRNVNSRYHAFFGS
jgi:hypothetical protein